MASTSEIGHARNVANFQELVTVCKGFGESYNPSNELIKIPSLESLYGNAVTALRSVSNNYPPWMNSVNDREILFAKLSKLCTRILNSVIAIGASKQEINDIKTLIRKLQGQRIKAKPENPLPSDSNPPPEPSTHSASQMSYDFRLENFFKLIKILESLENYRPNESEVNLHDLNNYFDNLSDANKEVVSAFSNLANARINRQTVLYNELSGLNVVAKLVKSYVKSVFGPSSLEFKKVNGISIVKISK